MKQLILIWLATIFCAMSANAQWDRVVFLTHDQYYHVYQEFVVDDSLRLHVFDVRRNEHTSPNLEFLNYQRFDSWGNPLSNPVVFTSDSDISDYGAGALIDRSNSIHVVWGRVHHRTSVSEMCYARQNLYGEWLTPPTIIPQAVPGAAQSGVNLVEARAGIIWAGFSDRIASFDEAGNILIVSHPIVYAPDYCDDSNLAVDTLDQVWACFRYFPDGHHQGIALKRINVPDTTVEYVIQNNGPDELQMSVDAFYIDRFGAFHYVLYADAYGLLYLRDPRDGSPRDTIIIDPNPYGVSATRFALVNDDTLEYIFDHSHPPASHVRVGFSLDGRMVLGPHYIFTVFGLQSNFIWKAGSYWIVGEATFNPPNIQTAMIHVPGPNEPPNGVPHGRDHSSTAVSSVVVYPQPCTSGFWMQLPLNHERITNVSLYNILGQKIAIPSSAQSYVNNLHFELPANLPGGRYYVVVQTSQRKISAPIIHLP